jgi:PadR family transcriptional regulator PadR
MTPKSVPRDELLKGTLDMLALKALSLAPMHGWAITERIEHWSKDILRMNQGSLYPALYRLEHEGYITSAWKMTENSRRARYYTLTAAGRRHLDSEIAAWHRVSLAINVVLAVQDAQ